MRITGLPEMEMLEKNTDRCILETKLCKHCHQPITHTTHNFVKYCNRHDCIRDRSNHAVKTNRRKAGKANRRCKYCNRTCDVPIDTPKGEAVCKSCAEIIKNTGNNPKFCSCCESNYVDPDLHFLCRSCFTHGYAYSPGDEKSWYE